LVNGKVKGAKFKAGGISGLSTSDDWLMVDSCWLLEKFKIQSLRQVE
jgi:hypothetical protein